MRNAIRRAAATLLALCGCAVFCLCAPAATIEVPLVYEQTDLPYGIFGGIYLTDDMSAPFPGTDWKAPDLVSERPLYFKFPVGDRLMILDKESEDDFVYNRLYADLDGNGDLTEHPPLIGDGDDSGSVTHTVFEVVLPSAKGGAGYRYELSVTQVKPGLFQGVRGALAGASVDRPSIFISTAFSYAAEVEVDGETYKLRLIDGNVDGRFEPGEPDAASRRRGGDMLMVDQAGERAALSWQPLGSWLALGGSMFKFDADTAAGKLALTPVDGETGRLGIKDSFETLTLIKDGPEPEYVMMYRPSGSLRLPVGAYSVLQYDLFAEDDSAVTWWVSASQPKEPAQFEIQEGRELPAPFGQPLVARGIVDGNRIKTGLFWRKYADLRFVFEGAGGEPLEHPVARRNGRRVDTSPPAYRITTGDGELVAQGRFEYG